MIDVEECGIPISLTRLDILMNCYAICGENIVTKMEQIIQIKAQKRGNYQNYVNKWAHMYIYDEKKQKHIGLVSLQ